MTRIACENDIGLAANKPANEDISLLAIGKALTDSRISKIRNKAEVGGYRVDTQISIRGEFVVHEDYKQTQVNKVCPWTFLQVAWNKLNQNSRNACIQEVQALLRTGEKPDVKDLKTITKAAVQVIKTDVEQTSRGQCKFNGTIWVP